MIGPYGDAAAFRAALETRLRQAALESRVPLDRLRKEVATQRMIARLAASEHADGWVLKGALVLLVRLDHAARATKDADTTWRYDAALLNDALDDAAGCDLGDGFEFQIGSGSRIGAETGEGGWRYSVRALLDGRLFEQFILDVNVSPDDPQHPRPVDRLTLRRVLDFAGIDPPTIAAVPVRFHLAEKLHAYVRIYAQARLSSRTKDLYDMLVMARSLPLPASDELHDAVTATFELRATSLPTTLPVPPAQWQRTWAGYVRDYSIPWTNLDSAYAALEQLGTGPRTTRPAPNVGRRGVDLAVAGAATASDDPAVHHPPWLELGAGSAACGRSVGSGKSHKNLTAQRQLGGICGQQRGAEMASDLGRCALARRNE